MPMESDDYVFQESAYFEGLESKPEDRNPYPRNFPRCQTQWNKGREKAIQSWV